MIKQDLADDTVQALVTVKSGRISVNRGLSKPRIVLNLIHAR
jgi:hypothetical protein